MRLFGELGGDLEGGAGSRIEEMGMQGVRSGAAPESSRASTYAMPDNVYRLKDHCVVRGCRAYK